MRKTVWRHYTIDLYRRSLVDIHSSVHTPAECLECTRYRPRLPTPKQKAKLHCSQAATGRNMLSASIVLHGKSKVLLTVKEHTTGLWAVENSPSYFLLMMYKFETSPTHPSGSNPPSSCSHKGQPGVDKDIRRIETNRWRTGATIGASSRNTTTVTGTTFLLCSCARWTK